MQVELVKNVCDVIALGVCWSSFFAWFTPLVSAIAAICSIVWFGIRFYEWYQKKNP